MCALVLGFSVAFAGVDVRLGGGLYPRFQADGMGNSFGLMSAEANVTARVSGADRDYLTAAIQFQAGSMMSGWARGFHFGEAYVLVPLGLRWPTIRVGQAVIPFGLLADYDVHTQIVQTPYARTLGLRIDPGIGLVGSLGSTDYWLWESNGNGPYVADNDKGKVVTTRIAPAFLLGNAEVTVGLSGFLGSMPYWPLDSLAMMEIGGPQGYVEKYRLGLDNTADWGPLTFRLEAVAGKDSSLSGPLVFSGYAEARYAIASWLEPIAKADGFWPSLGKMNRQEQSSYRSVGVGINFYPPKVSALQLQTLYERTWLNTGGMHEQEWRFAAQLAITF